MNRKQNSLMRFSRTERLAQLSEQEIVIEKKKKEIQAKLEAQKKKETEEVLKKLEFSKETKIAKPSFSKKPFSGNDNKKSSSQEKPVGKVKESLTNAFSNDGSFLYQFKKLSRSLAKNKEDDSKNSQYPKFEDSLSKGAAKKKENDIDRNNASNFKEIKTPRDNSQFNYANSSNSGVQLPTTSPGIFQFPQHQSVSELSAADSSKATDLFLPNQNATQKSVYEPYSNNMLLNSNQSNYSGAQLQTPEFHFPKLCTTSNSKEFPVLKNDFSGNSHSSPFIQSPVTSQNVSVPLPVPPPSVTTNELPKIRTESISMTLKVNPVKKLEAIPNPLEVDQSLSPTSVKKNHFNFSEKENSKSTFSNALHNYNSTPVVENVSSHDKKSLKISSAFYNEDEDEDNDDDVNDEDKNEDGSQLDEKYHHWAGLVARCGDEFEDSLRSRNENDPDLRFLSNKNSKEYLSYRRLVLKYRMRLKSSEEEPSEKCQKFDSPKTFNEQSRENKFTSDAELSLTKTSNEDGNKLNDYLGSNNQQEAKKPLKMQENEMNNEYDNASESKLKKYSLSDSQKETHPQETSTKTSKEENADESEQSRTEERRKRKRKSRWGDAEPTTSAPGIEANLDLQPPGKLPAPKSTLLSQLTRSDPGLIQYARQTFGSTNLSEEDWKKAEDHYKINLLYQDMIKKRAEVEKLERQGKFKYEYDSDEDTEGGTWEHKLRQQEMQATQLWAEELTRQAAGKHHIGDFLPPEELERFMEKYNAVKEGREPDLSDYKEYKLKEDNIGYRLLQKMGWNEGQGLGQDGTGITNPVNKASTRHENQGLGVERSDGLEPGDDEYDAYRKRMMLAYRFRPNPLNNPRRPYY